MATFPRLTHELDKCPVDQYPTTSSGANIKLAPFRRVEKLTKPFDLSVQKGKLLIIFGLI